MELKIENMSSFQKPKSRIVERNSPKLRNKSVNKKVNPL